MFKALEISHTYVCFASPSSFARELLLGGRLSKIQSMYFLRYLIKRSQCVNVVSFIARHVPSTNESLFEAFKKYT